MKKKLLPITDITKISRNKESFRIYALEKQFNCTCGGGLCLRSKGAEEDAFVCSDCHMVWVFNFYDGSVREAGIAKPAFIKQANMRV